MEPLPAYIENALVAATRQAQNHQDAHVEDDTKGGEWICRVTCHCGFNSPWLNAKLRHIVQAEKNIHRTSRIRDVRIMPDGNLSCQVGDVTSPHPFIIATRDEIERAIRLISGTANPARICGIYLSEPELTWLSYQFDTKREMA